MFYLISCLIFNRQLSVEYFYILLNSCKIFILEKSREEKALLEKITTELTHKEKEINKLDERLHVLESDTVVHQRFIKELEETLGVQKSKNNVSFSCINLKCFLFYLTLYYICYICPNLIVIFLCNVNTFLLLLLLYKFFL